MYYNQCAVCGANLDPGEKCDCQKEAVKKAIKDTVKSLSEPVRPQEIKFA